MKWAKFNLNNIKAKSINRKYVIKTIITISIYNYKEKK